MPPVTLYLDTARLGQMSSTAQRLSTAFIRLSAEEPFNLYCERFLREGFGSWPERYRRRFSGLRGWAGIEQLRHGIRRLAGTSERARVLLASRSLSFVKAAAKTAFRNCRKLLTTDLSWPSYQHVLADEAKRQGRHLVTILVRNDILGGRLTADELAEALAAAFVRRECDSLFLPAVDNLGVRVPIPEVVRRIETRSAIRFVLTDAAQALAHVPLAEVCRSSDFVIAGCHKWVRGYYPLGIGIVGERDRIPACGDAGRPGCRLMDEVVAGDPLAGFLENLETGRFAQHLETVNLGPLFSAEGALEDFSDRNLGEAERCHRLAASQLREVARQAGCHPIDMDRAFQSGIQLVKCRPRASAKMAVATSIERGLIKAGVVATGFESGLVRFSLPFRDLKTAEVSQILKGLQQCMMPMRHS